MTASVIGNQAAPAGAQRGRATWRDDLLAYDALPSELRLQLQTTPFEMDAAAVLMGYRQLRAHHGSELMAIAMTAGQIDQFMQEILARPDGRP